MRKPVRLSLPVVAKAASADPAACEPSSPHSNEFARGAAAWDEHFSRRNFLTLAGASLALAGVTGCSDRPSEPIVPYVDPPEQVLAGEPQFFATTLTRAGYGRGVIVTSREGRPVKIEGNPDHPASLGAADAPMQAAVLDLYDPRRSKSVTNAGEVSTFGAFAKALDDRLVSHAADNGDGLRVLTGATSSKILDRGFAAMRQRFPKSVWHAYEPLGRYNTAAGTRLAFGETRDLTYDFSAADIVVAFDSDFLTDEPGSLAYARQFADGRRVSAVRPAMNRLFVAEADWSVTGSRADHRLAASPWRVGVLLVALASQVGVGHAPLPTDLSPAEAAWLSAVSTDLHAHRGRSLVIVGESQPPEVHAAGLAINAAFDNLGRTVSAVRPVLVSPDAEWGMASLKTLVDDMRAGRVRTLLVLADNPARTAPADLFFADSLAMLSQRDDAFTAHLGPYANETAYACRWHVPAAHELETWGDAVAYDGTPSYTQPLIAPLTGGKTAIEIVNRIVGLPDRTAYDEIRADAAGNPGGVMDESRWADVLRRGTVPLLAASVSFTGERLRAIVMPEPRIAPRGIQVVLRADPSILDGNGFHNPWLQELPRPITKIVWGNAGLISPATAERHALADDDVVRLEADGRSIETPVLVLPGIADDVVVLHLGHGRHRLTGGDTAIAAANVPYGVDAYPLRTAASPGFASNVKLTPTGRKQHVVRTHNHHAMAAEVAADPSVKKLLTPHVIATPLTSKDDLALHNRKLVRTATLAEFFKTPTFAGDMDKAEIKQLYPEWEYAAGPQWGMTIDLTACIGCNACITACQAENNTPSVGADQVDKQREMHWLRVDSYVDAKHRVHHQPVACMHCENAPCEYVCPVAATTHSIDGLNQMTYNRCVGTRYCSNNCPYKVRRFNFLNYTFYTPQQYAIQRNPDVTVRTRGVMEKCTYCVQRINYADRKVEIAALAAGEDPSDVRRRLFNRLQTACQQTCPTRAIAFGDLIDQSSAVYRNKHDPRNYGLLTELSTKPRTTYLASVTNPNPSLEAGE